MSIKVKSKQSGIVDLANNNPGLVNINPIDLSKSILFVTNRSENNFPGDSLVYGEIESQTNLKFQRDVSLSASNENYWQVIEFDQNVTVERGVVNHNQTVQEIDLIKNDWNLNKSFVIITFKNIGSIFGSDDNIIPRLISPSKLRLDSFQTLEDTLSYQVVQFEDASVQIVTGILTEQDQVVMLTNPVNHNESFVMIHVKYHTTNATLTHRSFICADLSASGDRVTLRNYSPTGNRLDFQVTVVTIPGIKVQRESFIMNSVTTSRTLSSPVNLNRSFILIPGIYNTACPANVTYANASTSFIGSELSSSDTAQFFRYSDNFDSLVTYEVIEFPADEKLLYLRSANGQVRTLWKYFE